MRQRLQPPFHPDRKYQYFQDQDRQLAAPNEKTISSLPGGYLHSHATEAFQNRYARKWSGSPPPSGSKKVVQPIPGVSHPAPVVRPAHMNGNALTPGQVFTYLAWNIYPPGGLHNHILLRKKCGRRRLHPCLRNRKASDGLNPHALFLSAASGWIGAISSAVIGLNASAAAQ